MARAAGADENAAAAEDQAAGSTHWAFQPPVRPSVPSVADKAWPRNEIDHFILARLESAGFAPSAEADRVTLIRRLSFDLLGLPPSIEEVDAFVADKEPDAYEQLVDRLLASPHYGERWGRHWLDVARYADSNGYNIDAPREIWKYRDWVIDALNRDMPFDQFTVEQIAGDMLPDATLAQRIATGFHRNTLINQEGGIDKEQFRVEAVVDRVSTTGEVFLGITLGCARCHEHKYDPIAQREFYEFFAFLNSAEEPTIELAAPEAIARRDAVRAQRNLLEEELGKYAESLAERQPQWEASLTDADREKLKPEVRAVLDKPADQRSDEEKKKLFEAFKQSDAGLRERQETIDALREREPTFPTTMVLRERAEPRETYVHVSGDFTRRGETVTPAVPAVLHALPETDDPNRLDLARWLVDESNPLTARVTVNRIWQRYFGRGIVETENDFGTQGSPPSHPELLDWLATEFMARGWSMKALHRLIITSATYRQSSRHRPELAEVDPSNRLLGRQVRLRLEAEIVRDAALTASGLLSRKIGGPSVFPPQPEGAMTVGQMKRPWEVSSGEDRYRRGMYTFFWRATPYPALMAFDAPDSTDTCTRRNRSNTPLQALTLLNDAAFVELARGLAARVLREAPPADRERVRYAFRLCLARDPKPEELARLEELLVRQVAEFQSAPEEAEALAPDDAAENASPAQLAAWTALARVLMNLDEFITRE